MYIETKELLFPKPEGIVVKFEIDKALQHPFSIWVEERLVAALTEEEATTLKDKLGFAIEDHGRAK